MQPVVAAGGVTGVADRLPGAPHIAVVGEGERELVLNETGLEIGVSRCKEGERLESGPDCRLEIAGLW